MEKSIFLFLLVPFLSFCQRDKNVNNKLYIYPGSSWVSVNDVTKEGWSNDRLQKLERFIIDSTDATGVVVIQSGKILFDCGDTRETSYLASCRKSILSMYTGPL